MKQIIPINVHSKRVVNKNFRPFHNDLHITQIAINKAIEQGLKPIVLTNDDFTQTIKNAYIIKVPKHNEYPAIMGDLRYLIDLLKLESFILLQSTSPLIKVETIKEVVALQKEHPLNTVYTGFALKPVNAIGSSDNQAVAIQYSDRFPIPMQDQVFLNKYFDGGQIYTPVRAVDGLEKTMFSDVAYCVETDQCESLQIDTEQDFKIIQQVYKALYAE